MGQAWYDNWANDSTPAGKIALNAKEASIVQYFNSNLGIDFQTLQREIQEVIRKTYTYPNATFAYWMGQNLYKTITVDVATNPIYANAGWRPAGSQRPSKD